MTTILYRGLRNDFFFSGHILFFNFYLDFCFPLLFYLLYLFLFHLDFYFSFLFGIFFEYFEKKVKRYFWSVQWWSKFYFVLDLQPEIQTLNCLYWILMRLYQSQNVWEMTHVHLLKYAIKLIPWRYCVNNTEILFSLVLRRSRVVDRKIY